ncbi:MAG: hypothetical protein HYZ28_07000 [Myxococcales bacterium]|nr:hypothetical protein [Myxococcales bacterium]
MGGHKQTVAVPKSSTGGVVSTVLVMFSFTPPSGPPETMKSAALSLMFAMSTRRPLGSGFSLSQIRPLSCVRPISERFPLSSIVPTMAKEAASSR